MQLSTSSATLLVQNINTTVFLYVIACSVFFLLRLFPIWTKRFQGCDAYNILLCAEVLRRQKRLPICLPDVFILEDSEQWYPPGFLILCALLPESWLKRNYWLVNHLIDLAHGTVIFIIASSFKQPWLGVCIVILYAMLPSLVLEYANLNTRPLGVLLLSAFLLTAYQGLFQTLWIPFAALFGVALLFSHKLSSQQLWFSLPFLALFMQDWAWLLWMPGIYLLAYAFWPHGFHNILSGHRNIVLFWHRYWPLLGAHMVRQSPIYGDGNTRTDYYATDGWVGFLQFLKNTVHQNYFIFPVFLYAVAECPKGPFEQFLLCWIGSVYIWAIMIHTIKVLRGIGLASQYIKFAHLPIFLYIVLNGSASPFWIRIVFVLSALLTIRQYVLVCRNMKKNIRAQSGRISPELNIILDMLHISGDVRVLCLPVHLCDLVAYKARIPTYWGTHSHCFDEKLGSFFPVLRRRIEEYVFDDDLTHLLIDTDYVTAEELGLKKDSAIEQQGNYSLFRIDVLDPLVQQT